MVNLLVSDEPRRAADRILTRLVQIHQARGGAILRPRQGQVEIWMSVGLSLPAVSALPVRWADHAAELAAGRSVIESGFGLFPAMSGHEMFERYTRVHYNTMELLVIFVPSIWFFARYIDPRWAAGLGAIYLIGRLVYLRGYVSNPDKRNAGFNISMLPTLALLLGTLFGAVRAPF